MVVLLDFVSLLVLLNSACSTVLGKCQLVFQRWGVRDVVRAAALLTPERTKSLVTRVPSHRCWVKGIFLQIILEVDTFHIQQSHGLKGEGEAYSSSPRS